MIKRLLLANR